MDNCSYIKIKKYIITYNFLIKRKIFISIIHRCARCTGKAFNY